MINKPWKAEYWPQIVEELERQNEISKEDRKSYQNHIYIYDYANNIYKILGRKTDDRNSKIGRYFYITKAETMEKILDNWVLLGPNTQSSLKRAMKGYEPKYLHRVIYKKRKEEFDALVAKTNS